MAKRLVRRVPLSERIKAYPLDLILALNEAAVSIDWDDYVHSTLPLGVVLTTVFALLCKVADHYKNVRSRRSNDLFRADASVYRQVRQRAISGSSNPIHYPKVAADASSGSRWMWLVNALLIIFAVSSVINTIMVFWLSNREYTLLNSSANSAKPKGSNVTKSSVTSSTDKGIFGKILSYFEGHSKYLSDDESDGETTYDVDFVEKDVWVLKVWDPSLFQVHLSATFCPLTLFTIYLVSGTALWKIFLIILAYGISLFGLVSKFLSLIGDKQIIYQETFNEYNKKYVIPKTSILKKNAIVDATYGPMAASSMVAYDDRRGHLQNENAFYTHDIHGNRIKGVRADNQFASRSASPARHSPSMPINNYSRHRESSFADLYASTRDRIEEDAHQSWLTSSTPFLTRAGHDSFIRPQSPRHSPLKTPTRLSFSQRTQLSPSRTSPTRNHYTPSHRGSPSPTHLSRSSSPQRSSSPSKRPWQ
ncbi:hypothetical protein FT663_01917 [Candidozyma haemuli var. vulneris]|nr:hypothetical protein FT662_02644 [[Candida] haemuloni var. vulneris]KAF3993327.1 hypothetical protein FT663_01917 [[Candida] haemuloni var. vulneris]